MYVCMYVCMHHYVCMYVCIYVCMYVCTMYVYVYVCMYVSMCVCMYVVKLSSPDYVGINADEAIEDFKKRIHMYMDAYQTLDTERDK